MQTLVTTDWLNEHLDDPDLVILDCTIQFRPLEGGGFQVSSGRASYDEGHIPNAGFADLTVDLSDPDSDLQFAMPTVERFSIAMGALGVGEGTRVVLYDAMMSACAARVWWMLRWVGFDDAALLDGGLRAWQAEGRPLSTEPADRQARTLTPQVRPEVIADRDDVRAAIDDPAVQLIDTLSADHYSGKQAMYARPGHIPGASNVSAFEILDESGRYLSEETLRLMMAGDRDARTITYCGGGIAASSNAFILAHLGFTNVAVYTASLQEWAADPANPMVVGDQADGA